MLSAPVPQPSGFRLPVARPGSHTPNPRSQPQILDPCLPVTKARTFLFPLIPPLPHPFPRSSPHPISALLNPLHTVSPEEATTYPRGAEDRGEQQPCWRPGVSDRGRWRGGRAVGAHVTSPLQSPPPGPEGVCKLVVFILWSEADRAENYDTGSPKVLSYPVPRSCRDPPISCPDSTPASHRAPTLCLHLTALLTGTSMAAPSLRPPHLSLPARPLS